MFEYSTPKMYIVSICLSCRIAQDSPTDGYQIGNPGGDIEEDDYDW